jgi:hypothetical protein
MGFTHLRVLVLPKSFAEDWADKGYPVEKDSKLSRGCHRRLRLSPNK